MIQGDRPAKYPEQEKPDTIRVIYLSSNKSTSVRQAFVPIPPLAL